MGEKYSPRWEGLAPTSVTVAVVSDTVLDIATSAVFIMAASTTPIQDAIVRTS